MFKDLKTISAIIFIGAGISETLFNSYMYRKSEAFKQMFLLFFVSCLISLCIKEACVW